MRAFNQTKFAGRLYNYALQTITTENGDAISGSITLEVDVEGTTVEIKYFAYPKWNSGKVNSSYNILDSILSGNYATVVDNGDQADWLESTGSIDVNYFVSNRGNNAGEVVTSQRIRGIFINPNKEQNYENKFKLDFLITSILDIEEDGEKGYPRYLKVGGYLVDDYNNRVMSVNFHARSEEAINYISGLEASVNQPYFCSTWGQLTKMMRLVVTKSAFGEDEETSYSSTSWTITSMRDEPYEFGDESAITIEQYEEFRKNLGTFIEEVKTKNADRDTEKNSVKKELAF